MKFNVNIKQSLIVLSVVTVLSGCTASTNEIKSSTVTPNDSTITITEANFAHSETARNFRNWTMLGANKDIVHMKQLPARGKAAPTVQMNDDTLYSIVIAEAVEGKINFSIPKSDIYMAVQVVNEGGHGEHYVVAAGDYSVAIESDFAMLIYRTGTEKGLEAARYAQTFIKTDSFKFGTYEIQNYDFDEVETWVSRLTKETSGAAFEYTFPRTSKDITDRHQWNLENANGWGGSSPEVNIANKYTNSVMLDGDKCLLTTFENPESKYFTSVTAYSQDRYLIEGVKHVSSNTWKENKDGSVTVSFNCGQTAVNNIDTKGNDFTFTMRYYGLSQKVMDGKINPEKTVKEG
ncbi:DUF1214 domain-containing protein [Colwellia psychrerythraea]|uniref:Uncharacterized protein n=1 Tax=Colwellia psychrerythraea TaxID=28229 RepID=A0A099KJD5_COLPS|nr:DUF1214 domain-containing protein [Colwellia psychrerythraea]KGJ90944.1 protein of unknown function DUF1214 [Colwellia psychrerythraea]